MEKGGGRREIWREKGNTISTLTTHFSLKMLRFFISFHFSILFLYVDCGVEVSGEHLAEH